MDFAVSLDPLIAEAKQRMRRRRVIAAAVVLALAAGAIAGRQLSLSGSASTGHATDLTFTATGEFGAYAVYHLRCRPAGGDVPQPAKACAAIAASPAVVTGPKAFPCWGIEFAITIDGRLDGRPVHRKLSTCWTSQVPLIGKLQLAEPRATAFSRWAQAGLRPVK